MAGFEWAILTTKGYDVLGSSGFNINALTFTRARCLCELTDQYGNSGEKWFYVQQAETGDGFTIHNITKTTPSLNAIRVTVRVVQSMVQEVFRECFIRKVVLFATYNNGAEFELASMEDARGVFIPNDDFPDTVTYLAFNLVSGMRADGAPVEILSTSQIDRGEFEDLKARTVTTHGAGGQGEAQTISGAKTFNNTVRFKQEPKTGSIEVANRIKFTNESGLTIAPAETVGGEGITITNNAVLPEGNMSLGTTSTPFHTINATQGSFSKLSVRSGEFSYLFADDLRCDCELSVASLVCEDSLTTHGEIHARGEVFVNNVKAHEDNQASVGEASKRFKEGHFVEVYADEFHGKADSAVCDSHGNIIDGHYVTDIYTLNGRNDSSVAYVCKGGSTYHLAFRDPVRNVISYSQSPDIPQVGNLAFVFADGVTSAEAMFHNTIEGSKLSLVNIFGAKYGSVGANEGSNLRASHKQMGSTGDGLAGTWRILNGTYESSGSTRGIALAVRIL